MVFIFILFVVRTIRYIKKSRTPYTHIFHHNQLHHSTPHHPPPLFLVQLALHEPVKAVKEPLALRGTRFCYAPLTISDCCQAQGLGELGGLEGTLHVLLVGHDQEDGVLQLILLRAQRGGGQSGG